MEYSSDCCKRDMGNSIKNPQSQWGEPKPSEEKVLRRSLVANYLTPDRQSLT
jgi:hypothetical protein